MKRIWKNRTKRGIISILFLISIIGCIVTIHAANYKLAISDFHVIDGLNVLDDNQTITTTNQDSQVERYFDDIYIRNIKIVFKEPISNCRLQVFYASENEDYSEDRSVIYTALENEKIIEMPVEKRIDKIRIDFGDEADRVLVIDYIKVVTFDKKVGISLLLLAILCGIVVCRFIKHIVKEYKGIENKQKRRAVLFSVLVFIGIAILWLTNMKNGCNVFEQLFVGPKEKNGISMTFTSLNFIFVFLPLSVIGYYLIKNSIRNIFLVIMSVIFYAMGEPIMVWLLLLSIFINYVFGLLLAKEWNQRGVKLFFLLISMTWNFGLLFYYKYYIFTLENINSLFRCNIDLPNIVQPLGISFFTFRTISFCLDVYWKTVPIQTDFTNVALYVCFFPQVIMGPICKYNDFNAQLNDREFDSTLFLDGVKRIIIGWAKKLIIANNIGNVVDAIFTMNGAERSVALAWMGIFGYLIQLYYDFSGYSDIAIGIGQMFGFRTPENFNYPFVSKSVVEYWTRWHITLGTWLKNYLYTPIFRKCQDKDINLSICNVLALLGVWLFAGVWHGVGWNFVCYGLYYFAFIVFERIVEDHKKKKRKKLKIKKKPETMNQKICAHIYFFAVLIFGQLLFRCKDLQSFGEYLKSMFGVFGNRLWDAQTYFYVLQSMVLMIVGWIFAFPVVAAVKEKMNGTVFSKIIDAITPILYACLLVVSIAFAMTDTYQSFIYFQF